MIYKVGICGATGRVGLEMANLMRDGFVQAKNCLEMADAVSANLSLVSVEGIEVRTLDEPPREPVHIWIDFSHPEGTVKLLENIDTPVVIGTTGFSGTQLETIHAYSQKAPTLLASNMSPGMNLVMKWLEMVPSPEKMPFETHMEELHHRHKKDAPSGTAKTLLDILEKQGYENTPVNAVRSGSIRGIHSIRFISDDEIIEVKHQALNRQVFARGALLAALFLLKDKEARLYTMNDVFFENDTNDRGKS